MEPVGATRPGSRSGARAARDAAPHWCREPPVAAAPGRMRDGTGSGSWLCHPGCLRAVAGPGVRAAARMGRDAARPETAPPRPHTRPTAQAERPACRRARSAFFRRRVGIGDAHYASMFALAHHHAGLAPGAALLPAQTSLVQGAPDRKGADLGQSIVCLAQGLLQQAQGPGGRAVLLALGRAGPFGQNALRRVSPIAGPRSAPVARPQGRESLAVEATDTGSGRWTRIEDSWVVGKRVGWWAMSRGGEPWRGLLSI